MVYGLSFILASVIGYFGLGGIVVERIYREIPKRFALSFALVVGLFLSLPFSFFAFHFKAGLAWSAGIPLFIGLCAFFKPSVRVFFREGIRNAKSGVLSPFFLLWCGVQIAIGYSLFSVDDGGISVSWKNNYGDLAFHLGMISSFVFGDNSDPEYHIFVGERLTYPFFINLWSALWWWIYPKWEFLRIIFVAQWLILWVVFFEFIEGRTHRVLPWCVLLGGGSYLAWGHNSGEMIDHNIPWTVFLTTIWVTQRSALIGVVALTSALSLTFVQTKQKRSSSLLSGLIFGLSPLIHMHFLIVGAMATAGVLLCESRTIRERITNLGFFIVGTLPAILFLPWILGKGGMVGIIHGWHTGEFANLSDLSLSISQWTNGTTGTVWLLLTVIVFGSLRAWRELCGFILLFLLGNVVRLSIWDWDQIKYFLALYVFTLVWLSKQEYSFTRGMQGLLLILVIPSVGELSDLHGSLSHYTIYSAEDLATAKNICETVPHGEIIAGAPDHNSPITLSGSRFYYGYEGTLYSHGIPYSDRQKTMNVSELSACSGILCPRYLLWTDRERRYFKQEGLPTGFQATAVPEIFKRN